jgi:O-antigen/teichoic acid export membrane protein
MSESLKATTLRNVGYNSVAKIIHLVVMAVANIIMTRTLAPSDYGIVGFAGIFTAFLAQFSDFGIRSAVIQKKELEQRELYTAFTIKFIIGLVLCVLAFLGAPLAVWFFDNPVIVVVIRVMALNFVMSTFSILPEIMLTRKLDYKKIAMANLVPAILNSAAAVSLALMGFKYWSLVIASLVMTLSTCVMLNILQPVRYRFAFSREAAARFIRFGGNVFMAGFITFLIFNADNFLIGAVKGATNLGFYSLAFNWGSMACTMIASIVLSVLFPTFSRMQGDRERLKSSYLKVLQYISFGGVLVNMTLFVVSRDFLFLVLGHHTDKWMPALTALRILCFYGVVRLLLEPVGQVVMAIGRTDVLRKATLLVATVELIGLYPALYFLGIEGVALLITFAYAVQYALYYVFLRRELDVTFKELCSCVGPAFWGMLVLSLVFLIGEISGGGSSLVFMVKLVGCVGTYLIVYGVATKWRLYKDVLNLSNGYL